MNDAQKSPVKKISTWLLQLVVVVFGTAVFASLLIEPHFEGRNVNASIYEVYFNDPFLLYVYTASIAFFVALHQAIRLLGFITRDSLFSEQGVRVLRTIKYCGVILVGFAMGAEAWLFLYQRGRSDDIAGGVFMGLLAILFSGVVATTAGVFEGLLEKAIALKSESATQ